MQQGVRWQLQVVFVRAMAKMLTTAIATRQTIGARISGLFQSQRIEVSPGRNASDRTPAHLCKPRHGFNRVAQHITPCF